MEQIAGLCDRALALPPADAKAFAEDLMAVVTALDGAAARIAAVREKIDLGTKAATAQGDPQPTAPPATADAGAFRTVSVHPWHHPALVGQSRHVRFRLSQVFGRAPVRSRTDYRAVLCRALLANSGLGFLALPSARDCRSWKPGHWTCADGWMLVRRDDVEHLILLGQDGDGVIERHSSDRPHPLPDKLIPIRSETAPS